MSDKVERFTGDLLSCAAWGAGGRGEGASGMEVGSWVSLRRTSPFFRVQSSDLLPSQSPVLALLPLPTAMMVCLPSLGPSQLPAFLGQRPLLSSLPRVPAWQGSPETPLYPSSAPVRQEGFFLRPLEMQAVSFLAPASLLLWPQAPSWVSTSLG